MFISTPSPLPSKKQGRDEESTLENCCFIVKLISLLLSTVLLNRTRKQHYWGKKSPKDHTTINIATNYRL
jgi:hypothetical protein